MNQVTKLDIILKLDSSHSIDEVVSGLPDYSASTFVQVSEGLWKGDFTISCSIAPELAEGDFVDDFAPYFRTLLDLRTFHAAKYSFQISVGSPSADVFNLDATSVALLAALGAPIKVALNRAGEQDGACNTDPQSGSLA